VTLIVDEPQPDTPRIAPWAPCEACMTFVDSVVPRSPPCLLCHGLGLALPPDWLASEWTILFMLPEECFDVRSPEGFLRIVLEQVYPIGGYRVMPISHPYFATAVKFAADDMVRHSIEHKVLDPSQGRFEVSSKAGKLTRHLRAVLLERPPSRPRS
jgi:hypothetical protein